MPENAHFLHYYALAPDSGNPPVSRILRKQTESRIVQEMGRCLHCKHLPHMV